MDPAITPREFGRIEERVDGLRAEVAQLRGELGTKIDALSESFERASTKQGERIGILEQKRAAQEGRERMLILIWALIQAVGVAILGAWIKNYLPAP